MMHLPQIVTWTATWVICVAVFLLILWRPRRVPVYAWAAGGAMLLILLRLIAPVNAWGAVRAGTSVYLFLAGMMLLAELAREHGVFDWLAAVAMERAHGSQFRLFVFVYVIAIVVTALLSNDATAVLLTPAVLAVVRRTKTSPLPYLFACAFIANAASFVLPISNPANLVVFAGHLPSLGRWLHIFLLPAICGLAVTFVVLWLHSRAALRQPMQDGVKPQALEPLGKRAGLGILLAAAGLLTTSALGGRMGWATAAAGIAVMIFVARLQWRLMTAALRNISWGVIPLVAGLFIMVEALKGVGALALSTKGLEMAARWPAFAGTAATSFGFGIASNAINNLPTGVIGAAAVNAAHSSTLTHAAVLLGINLGPNLSVTGSLATILWMMALQREGIEVSGWQFLRMGMLVMPTALLLAVAALLVTGR
jgi:arsenical pump membrane protein